MRFIESILFENGNYHNLAQHQKRVDLVFSKYAPEGHSHNLKGILPDLKMDGVYKVRLVYDMDSEDATYDLEFAEYRPRKIETLELVHSKPFDYSMKFEDRDKIDKLVAGSNADDIIIVIDNHITDGSYFNLVFWTEDEWLTPNTPLLKGVRRSTLLEKGTIKEVPIQIHDISTFKKVSLINAMIDLGELEIPISAILPPKTGD